ncbi:MAG: OmpA family protein [Candidatus Thiodiazotropha endolucinida]
MAGLDQDNALIQTEQTQGPGTYQDPGLVMDKMPSNETQRLSFLAATIEDMLSDYVDQELVDVSFTEDRVIVNMKDKMLFPSASAHLSREAVNALRSISRVLNTVPNQIQVEGNTDNRPISTKEFPSNWELSAARAASVVHLMTRMGIGAQRLSAVGYAEHRPVADNGTESGRAKNRRVSLIIMGMNGGEDRVIDLPTGGQ